MFEATPGLNYVSKSNYPRCLHLFLITADASIYSLPIDELWGRRRTGIYLVNSRPLSNGYSVSRAAGSKINTVASFNSARMFRIQS